MIHMNMAANHQPQVLLVTFPAQGHIKPSLQFAKRLISHGVHVTFMTSASAFRRMNTPSPPPQGLSYATFSDDSENNSIADVQGPEPVGSQSSIADVEGPKPVGSQSLKDHVSSIDDVDQSEPVGSQSLRDFIAEKTNQGTRFASIVYSNLLPWVAEVAREFHIPTTFLWNQPASLLAIYRHYFKGYGDVIENGVKDPSFLMELPGLPLLTRHDLPSFLIPPETFKDHIEILDQETRPRVLVNTVDALEAETMRAMNKYYNLVGVGPLMPSEGKNPSFGGDLFEANEEYKEMEWLNSKPQRSVIYVSLGSHVVVESQQMEELAKGLLETGRPFLWVIRENEGITLSCQAELEKQGMIVGWCSQVEVLSHPSVGCFVTHCGWNSTLESLASGVPMVTFPQWSDQPTNAKLVEDVWKTGVRVTKDEQGIVQGCEFKRCVELVMGGGDRGEKMRGNANKWKELTREATEQNGSSDNNLKAFVDHLTTLV